MHGTPCPLVAIVLVELCTALRKCWFQLTTTHGPLVRGYLFVFGEYLQLSLEAGHPLLEVRLLASQLLALDARAPHFEVDIRDR